MIGWLALHRRAAAAAAQRLAHNPLGTLLSALVVAIALVLPALGYVLADSASRLAHGLSGRPEISVFMQTDAKAADTAAVEKSLKSDPDVAALRFVPKDEAIRQLTASTGLGDVAKTVGNNPLPDAFVVTPQDDTPAAFARLRDRIAHLPGIAHVQLDTEWVQRLFAAIELARSAVAALAGLLGAALVIITLNTIRLQILTHRHEISVSLLLGATRSYVRRPYLYFGAFQGLLGGLLAWGLLIAILSAMHEPARRLAESYGIPLELGSLSPKEIATLLGAATLLGFVGAALSVHRHLMDATSRD